MNEARPFIPWLPFVTLLQKEVRRFWRVASQTLLTPIITASLYLFVFGATLGDRISVLPGFSYAQFVLPGLILMGVINNAFANTSSSLFMSRYLGNIVDLLVTPVTPAQFILAYTLAAMLRGLPAGSPRRDPGYRTLAVQVFLRIDRDQANYSRGADLPLSLPFDRRARTKVALLP